MIYIKEVHIIINKVLKFYIGLSITLNHKIEIENYKFNKLKFRKHYWSQQQVFPDEKLMEANFDLLFI